MDIPEVFAHAVAALDSAEIEFALVGGLAANLWVDSEHVRDTHDVDFSVLSLDHEPAARVAKILSGKGLAVSSPTHSANPPVEFQQVTVEGILIDFVVPRNSGYVMDAFRRSARVAVMGADIRVLQPEDVFLFKALAGRPKDVQPMWAMAQRPDFDWHHVRKWADILDVAGFLREMRLMP